ncbi:23753_t:CDS:2 [Dentiscutata erythropus]|uniref:23753_t:CDS:1 n=1 Tax=Dentiscutata erythropus TaxID=1348616 RepID=A0A9N9DEL3_9GLOM|nr:23753_t:CDS:2 [Dentiscutata erythropus]
MSRIDSGLGIVKIVGIRLDTFGAQSVIPMPYYQGQIEALTIIDYLYLHFFLIDDWIRSESALSLELFELLFIEFALDLKLSEIGSKLGMAVKLIGFVRI